MGHPARGFEAEIACFLKRRSLDLGDSVVEMEGKRNIDALVAPRCFGHGGRGLNQLDSICTFMGALPFTVGGDDFADGGGNGIADGADLEVALREQAAFEGKECCNDPHYGPAFR